MLQATRLVSRRLSLANSTAQRWLFRRGYNRTPYANPFFASAGQNELQIFPIRGLSMNAETIRVRSDLDQLIDQFFHVHTAIGFTGSAAVSGACSHQNLRAFGA